jgi:hypothetical protein
VKAASAYLCEPHAAEAKEAGFSVRAITHTTSRYPIPEPTGECSLCRMEAKHPVLRAMFPTAWDRINNLED